jgi:hypothetical protein
MNVTYNNFSLSNLGEVSVTQKREFEGNEAPQRAKVSVMLKVCLYERSYGDNYALLEAARTALAIPNAVLFWQNSDTNEIYINQTATLTMEDLPEAWGTYYQEMNLSFFYYENLDVSAQNLPLTFTPDGGAAITFSNVTAWSDGISSERFSTLRKNRKETRGRLDVEGFIYGDGTQSLAVRRTAFAAQVAALRTAMNSAQGNLVFGASGQQIFSGSVRVTEFKAEVNQAITQIGFKFTAVYTLFPNEAGYATCEATAEQKINFSGESVLNLAGKILSQTEAAARVKLGTVLAAFLTQYGYASGAQQLEINSTANLISANADGDTFTELTFSASYRKWDPLNQMATFTATGNKTAIPFGNVKLWEDGYKAERFDQMRSERRHSTGSVQASGTYAGDASLALPQRRAALLAMQRRMKTECNNAEGKLVYGDWNQVVRIEDFIAHVNQAETGIDWAFSASYSLFPNEGGYVTCEFAADTRSDIETGDAFLTFTGEILAPNGALARAKLATLRAATLAIYGFTSGQQLKADSATHEISANGDVTSTVPEGIESAGDVAGVSFLKLTFNEEYRQRMAGTVLSSTYTINTRDETATNLLMTTYAGSVTATGASADAAMAAAIIRALAIGANKQSAIDASAFLKSQSLTVERRQTSATQPEEFVRVSFSYEYQSKLAAGRAYLEMNTQTLRSAFEPDSDSVSGFVVAKDFTTASAIYQQQVKALYTGRLIRTETLTQQTVEAEAPTGSTQIGGNIFGGVPGNPVATTDSLAFVAQQLRLEFSFTAHTNKPAGRVTARYAMSVSRDFRSLKCSSRLRGSVFALDRPTADTFLLVLTTPLGQLMESSRDEDHDYTPEADVFTKLDFDDLYEGRLTGVAGLIEMHVTESVTYSATRWAVQPIPRNSNGGGGVSILQDAGQTEGSRTVKGSVSSASRTLAEAWASRHQSMLTGDNDKGFYPQAPQLETEFDFAPRVDGIAEDGLAGAGTVNNVQIYRVNFSFSEILPNYLPVV